MEEGVSPLEPTPAGGQEVSSQLADKCFSLGAQAVAAGNSLAILAAYLTRLSEVPGEMTADETEEVALIAAAINVMHLTQASLASERSVVWSQ